MLVLSRRLGEKIVIDGNIIVTIVKIEGTDKARIGVEAPADVEVWREEISKYRDPKAPKRPKSPTPPKRKRRGK